MSILTGQTSLHAPHKLEAGTPPIAQAIAMGAAVDYLDGIGMEFIAAREAELLRYAEQRLAEVIGVARLDDKPVAAVAAASAFDGSTLHAQSPFGAIAPEGAEQGRSTGWQLSTVTTHKLPARARILRLASWYCQATRDHSPPSRPPFTAWNTIRAPLRSACWTCLPMLRLGFMYASVRIPAARSSFASASESPCVFAPNTVTSTCTTVLVRSGGISSDFCFTVLL